MEIPPPPPPPSAAPSLIEAVGLTKLYGDFPAVTDLSFSVRAGEVIGLVGPNGAGKTTTLRCLSGIIPPTRGVGADLRPRHGPGSHRSQAQPGFFCR